MHWPTGHGIFKVNKLLLTVNGDHIHHNIFNKTTKKNQDEWKRSHLILNGWWYREWVQRSFGIIIWWTIRTQKVVQFLCLFNGHTHTRGMKPAKWVIKKQICGYHYTNQIMHHTYVDTKKPTLVFLLEMHTNFETHFFSLHLTTKLLSCNKCNNFAQVKVT